MTIAPDTLHRPHEWTLDAICCRPGMNPRLWDAPTHTQDGQKAVEWCRQCPTRERCLDYALAFEGDAPIECRQGIYGALGPVARATIGHTRHR